MRISEDHQAQRVRLSAASSALWDLIYGFNVDGEYLTQAEWLVILHDVAGEFIRRKLRFARMGRKGGSR